ncbi:Der GTPase-activating protein YihI [Thalassotalea sp. PLHSN55]|uniref:Der GTPase-activating protein YihI n=1 Tax=Thalassotalea sp. PLHSN55 TaxID=3435888 RepID=UPI003F8350EF
MSRTKKSRKPSESFPTLSKVEKQKLAELKETRIRKKKGKKPGNRQQEAVKKKTSGGQQTTAKDPRIGSKKPIDLGIAVKTAPAKKVKKKPEPIAAIRTIEVAEPDNSLEEQLYAIEQDPRLLAILDKQEDDVELTEAEVSLYNELMERHQDIRAQLGLDDDEDEVDASDSQDNSEDDLWDKLDSSDLSKFE